LVTKDKWDKFEITAKAAGVLIIPLAIAGSAYFLNYENAERQAVDTKIRLAFEIIDRPEAQNGADELLRNWAQSVIQDPVDAPDLPAQSVETITGLPNSYIPGLGGRATAVCKRLEGHTKKLSASLVKLGESDFVDRSKPDNLFDPIGQEAVTVLIMLEILCEGIWERSADFAETE
jgi:hypothetical protein